MSVIDAKDIFISNGTINRWQPGNSYEATGPGLSEVINDAIEGKPFFVNGSLVSHAAIISSYVKELTDLAKKGLLCRAVDCGSDEALSARFHRLIDLEEHKSEDSHG